MLVDGNQALVSFLAVFLNHAGYKIIAASNPIQGLAIWQERRKEIAVVIAGLHFDAGADGVAFLSQLRREDPSVKAILSSGDYPSAEGYQWLRANDIPFLPKPYLPQEILDLIENSLRPGSSTAKSMGTAPPEANLGRTQPTRNRL